MVMLYTILCFSLGLICNSWLLEGLEMYLSKSCGENTVQLMSDETRNRNDERGELKNFRGMCNQFCTNQTEIIVQLT